MNIEDRFAICKPGDVVILEASAPMTMQQMADMRTALNLYGDRYGVRFVVLDYRIRVARLDSSDAARMHQALRDIVDLPSWRNDEAWGIAFKALPESDDGKPIEALRPAPEHKLVTDALHRAIATARNGKNEMFPGDADIIASFMARGTQP